MVIMKILKILLMTMMMMTLFDERNEDSGVSHENNVDNDADYNLHNDSFDDKGIIVIKDATLSGGTLSSPFCRWLLGRAPCSQVPILTV